MTLSRRVSVIDHKFFIGTFETIGLAILKIDTSTKRVIDIDNNTEVTIDSYYRNMYLDIDHPIILEISILLRTCACTITCNIRSSSSRPLNQAVIATTKTSEGLFDDHKVSGTIEIPRRKMDSSLFPNRRYASEKNEISLYQL